MKYREEGIRPDQVGLDFKDKTKEKEYIKFGPAHRRDDHSEIPGKSRSAYKAAGRRK